MKQVSVSITVHAEPPESVDAIRPGQVFERRCFTEDQIAALRELWRMRPGTIQDPAHRGVEVVQFIARRTS